MPDPAERLAESIIVGYRDYRRRFGGLTRRAGERFEARDWGEGQEDARERILLYDVVVHETLRDIRQRLRDSHAPDTTPDTAPGATSGATSGADPGRVRGIFADWARDRPDSEIAETFYNSVIRRLHGTVGVDPASEFVAGDVDEPGDQPHPPWIEHSLRDGFGPALHAAIRALPFRAPWHQRDGRVDAAAQRLRRALGPDREWTEGALQVLRAIFYRNKAAYVVGRLVRRHDVAPVVLALLHPHNGITLDAILTTSDEASIVFGFTRSYMHADVGAPRATVDFLHSLMPLKRVDELYTAIGFNRHGKTEFYRTLREHLAEPEARFEVTPGKEGLVMIVFTLPALNVVFKVIRDRFGHPKKTTRARVKRNYGLIFVRDRVGRLADAQEFERIRLPRERFHPDLLEDLLSNASRTTSLHGDTVVIEHMYTERRVRPLDLYLDEVDRESARRATLDMGQAIKDLAAADIFPGDMLVKNFGVTRHGRVIFYDYDEVALLTDCNIRQRPQPRHPEDELADAPHFYVGPHDLFPEEWRAFLGPPGPLRHKLHGAHPELLDPAWWRDMQDRQRAGEVVDFFPYDDDRRLP